MEKVEPQQEHKWLEQLVGEWTMTGSADCGPDGEKMDSTGKESVSSVGGLWVVCEGEGTMPGGGMAQMRMTLGYDAARKKFVGTWIGSMMANMWIYEGELDETGKILHLRTEGPGFEEGTIGQYRDSIEIKSADHRTLTSATQQSDGSWKQFMQADYRRV